MTETLEDALNNENAADKQQMLDILTPNTKSLDKEELELILKGESENSYKVTELHTIRKLAVYRIRNGHSIFPFDGLSLGDDHIQPSY